MPKVVPTAAAEDAGVGYADAGGGAPAPRPTEGVVEPETVMVCVVS